jgi:uncharacterized protein YfcZ (UPF0381/DUF406 family)
MALDAQDMANIQQVFNPQLEQVNKTVMLAVDTMVREGDRNRQTTVRIFERMDKQEVTLTRIDERMQQVKTETQEIKQDAKEVDVAKQETKRWTIGQWIAAAGVVSFVVMWVIDRFSPKG